MTWWQISKISRPQKSRTSALSKHRHESQTMHPAWSFFLCNFFDHNKLQQSHSSHIISGMTSITLESQIEAILFWKGEPVEIKRLSELLKKNETEIAEAL